ncbi:MAG: RtcB family protein [Planctomycetes bacterium]|nr:RtcB family protein [Planctomycetota bacterium]
MQRYQLINTPGGVPIKAWIDGVPLEPQARNQLQNVARLPIIHGWLAVMPDVHLGYGATIGSVIPTVGAVIPSAVGVDIGCGMMACRTSLRADDLPESLRSVRESIERAVPHGRTSPRKGRDKGSWENPPDRVGVAWKQLDRGYQQVVSKYRRLETGKPVQQLGTLGGGNHFIELCLDEAGAVWIMLHSGSRGVGNRFGTQFIAMARQDMERQDRRLPDMDLAYFQEGSEYFDDYVFAVEWAQNYARVNRELMMAAIVETLKASVDLPDFVLDEMAVNCHHNYVTRELHGGQEIFVTRKGAVRAGLGDMGIIPGSMGAKSYIVRGKGNPESFHSCSHGAGRTMSRTQAKAIFSEQDHVEATRGVECRKDRGVIDETPAAYKPIEAVMAAQNDLVDIVHTLKQVVCVKG